MESSRSKVLIVLYLTAITSLMVKGVTGWTGEIHGRVICDVCADSSVGPEDHVLEGSFLTFIFI